MIKKRDLIKLKIIDETQLKAFTKKIKSFDVVYPSIGRKLFFFK